MKLLDWEDPLDFSERGRPDVEEIAAGLFRAVHAPAQMSEVITQFRHSHLSVNAVKDEVMAALFPVYSRLLCEHAFGNFRAGFGVHPLLAPPVERLVSLSEVLSARLFNTAKGEIETYEPSEEYPDSYLSAEFQTFAQTIKLDLGLRLATVDIGGWDTHGDQVENFAGSVNM